ncbi:MAG: polyprenol monophosphomannose synthase [Candidatus Tectomicrobia bacterium]|uniref:Polyprenol monophosphomannose synthase n=1 Tax=Tectimicrobiota bacterium TaxID=2528274 RepID=A0A933GKN1_UNCTE|nr:polyprenol monophosphomannose synthase [Candidatus Tectomicrobia bacterium]
MKKMNIWVMIPTYNEAENIGALIESLLNLNLGLSIVVVDDDSPDGTAQIVEEWCRKSPQVHLLLRKSARGRGSAGLAGFSFVLKQLAAEPAENKGPAAIMEMDADFSHHPKYIPALVAALSEADVALGSRMVHNGEDHRMGLLRKVISFCANFYLRQILSLPVQDCTSGFRAFKREVLEQINPDLCISRGPEVVTEILYRAHRLGFKIIEVPIVFADRTKGHSTFNFRVALRGLLMPLLFRMRCNINSSSHRGPETRGSEKD